MRQVFLASRGYRYTKEQLALAHLPHVRELEKAIRKVKELSGDASFETVGHLEGMPKWESAIGLSGC